MLNQLVIVGRLVKDVELKETEGGKKVGYITLAVSRPYKNAEGQYDTDFIDCVLWTAVAENTAEYCQKGNLVGIKGRIQTRVVDENKITELIAEKVTFLSTKKED